MYKDILLPVDLGEESSWNKALPTAIELAQAFGCQLHLMTVVPDFGSAVVASYFPKDYEKQAILGAKEALHNFAKQHVPAGVKIQHIVAHGTVYEEILACARRIDADLIIMGSHRPALKDFLIGPNASRVVRHADRSVLVVRG